MSMRRAHARIGLALVVLSPFACDCGAGLRPADALLASPASIDFGDVAVGTRRTVDLSLNVQGAGTVTVASVRIEGDGAFTIAQPLAQKTIGAGESGWLVPAFTPPAAGPFEATLVVENDSTNASDLRVALRGRGVEAPACDDGVACTEDAWDAGAGACIHTPRDTLCDSNDRCGAVRCDAVQGCVPGTPVSCDDANACTDDGCDPATGACANVPVANGTPCVGAGACNGTWVCRTGECTCSPRDAVGSGHVYPLAWPKAGGGMLVAVPVEQTRVQVYHMVGAPHGSAYRRPFPTTPEQTISPALADRPLVLHAPASDASPFADEDHFYILVSEHPLVISMADDERHQPGSPDRIFFMPSTSGTFRGRTFYAQSNGGDASERIRVMNLGGAASATELFAWTGDAWRSIATTQVAPGEVAVLTPNVPMAPYKVVTAEDSLVLVGYTVDNATAPAVDEATGMTVGTRLLGYGNAWHLRAIEGVSYVVEHRPDGGAWSQLATGSLAKDQSTGSSVGAGPGWFRLTLTGGTGWAILGTPSLLSNVEWNGYFLPAQDAPGCFVGTRFFTNASARTVSVLPNAGTTINIYDEANGSLLHTYTSSGAWEFHNAYSTGRVRAEFVNGPGAVILVGSLNFGDCNEETKPASCGILEGGYSIPAASGFRCRDDTTLTLTSCRLFAGQESCTR